MGHFFGRAFVLRERSLVKNARAREGLSARDKIRPLFLNADSVVVDAFVADIATDC